MSRTKRAIDVVGATLGLCVLCPIFAIIAGAIALCDDGPVFFRQERVGVDGTMFRMWKFRTMVKNAESLGRQLTVGDDPRITRLGRLLRRTKLDELPQLYNVLRGEMSLVGPRPEVPRYVAMYTHAERRVLALTPGITDPASLIYFDENGRLGAAADPERMYVEQVMPEKIRINLAYAARASALRDMRIVTSTLLRVISRGVLGGRASTAAGPVLLP